MNIQDLPILVTVGASGLGLATAEYLVNKGAKVALLDRVLLDKHFSYKVLALADVTDEKSVTEALSVVEMYIGTPRVVINAAGILGGGRVVTRTVQY